MDAEDTAGHPPAGQLCGKEHKIAPQPDLLRELRTAEESRCAALLAGDADRLSRILGPHLTYVHASARTEDRGSILAGARQRPVKVVAFAHEDLATAPLGPAAALLTGIIHITVRTAHGDETRRCRFTSSWTQSDGEWRLASWQNTILR